ncbi:MAG: hypothetical protein EPN84_02935 [Legionella sp.]|nr:MAG: hypothetical protein EPN84_02935 [Legionella sp.]
MLNSIYLAEACENTFIIVDCLDETEVSQCVLDELHICLVQTKRDDALILINGQQEQDALSAEMLVFGADKLFGDFCGNGSRACAAYLYATYPQYKRFFIRAQNKHRALTHYGNDDYAIELPSVNFVPNEKFIHQLETFKKESEFYQFQFGGKTFFYSDVIEPHLILNEQLSEEAIEALGIELNLQKELFPLGINLTVFYKNEQDQQLETVTFERGVRRLTKSCGTGACCAAAFYLKGKPGAINVQNPGGLLQIYNKKSSVRLQGPGVVTGTFCSNTLINGATVA